MATALDLNTRTMLTEVQVPKCRQRAFRGACRWNSSAATTHRGSC